MIIHFPHMHTALMTRPPSGGEVLFDPGLAAAEKPDETPRFRPETLPVDPKMLRRMVADFIRFGEQFRNIRDLADLKGTSGGPHAGPGEESERAVRAGLARQLGMDTGAPVPEKNNEEDDLRTAQLMLGLAWTLEEQLVESMGVEQGLSDAMSRLKNGLGLDEENLDEDVMRLGRVAADQTLPSFNDQPLPWRNILGAMLRFVPEDCVLLIADPEAEASLIDAGISFADPADAGLDTAGLPSGASAARVRSGDLVRASAEAGPWADRYVIVARIS